MIIAIVIMFIIACITLLTIVNMICNCIIESKKDDEGNVYTVNFEEEKEEEKNER